MPVAPEVWGEAHPTKGVGINPEWITSLSNDQESVLLRAQQTLRWVANPCTSEHPTAPMFWSHFQTQGNSVISASYIKLTSQKTQSTSTLNPGTALVHFDFLTKTSSWAQGSWSHRFQRFAAFRNALMHSSISYMAGSVWQHQGSSTFPCLLTSQAAPTGHCT